jgi:ADP-dependent phosphofructokinase/glucokinase
MNIELVTKQDLETLESKLNELLASFQADTIKGLGRVYNTKELSEKLKVSTKTINNWREQRLIEFCKVHNTILFTEKAVLEFLSNHSIKRKNSLFNATKTKSHE